MTQNNTMLWLSLHFYQLPLDVFTPDIKSTLSNKVAKKSNSSPLAIAENFRLIYCNQAAQECGLTANMKVATAHALCTNLTLKERNLDLEFKTLVELANSAYEFSSQVCLYDDKTILLELSGSRKLFINIDNLLSLLQKKLAKSTINYSYAIASTPKQSFLLSLYHQQNASFNQLIKNNSIVQKQRIENIPIDFIAKDINDNKLFYSLKNNISQAKNMGIKQIGELFKLPDSALGRRFGKNFLIYLHRLKGKLSDPLKLHTITETFNAQRCFLSGLDSVEQILFPARVMLNNLIAFLNLRRKMACQITWRFECFNGSKISIDLSLSSQVQTTHQLLSLTRLKLQSIEINEKIETVFLEVSHFLSKEEQQNSLALPSLLVNQPSMKNENALNTLHDNLNARLNQHSYLKLTINDEYLPEKHSQTSFAKNTFEQTNIIKPADSNNFKESKPTPLWIMESPVKIQSFIKDKTSRLQLNYKGQLDICSTAEKIETFWWNIKKESEPTKTFDNLSKRRYFIAQSEVKNKRIRYWVFHEQNANEWFIHGIF